MILILTLNSDNFRSETKCIRENAKLLKVFWLNVSEPVFEVSSKTFFFGLKIWESPEVKMSNLQKSVRAKSTLKKAGAETPLPKAVHY